MELLVPYISEIVQSLIGLVTIVIIALLAELRKYIINFITSRTNANHQALLEYIANQSFAYIEQTMANESSQNKINAAIRFASEQLEKYGVDITTTQIRGAIEKSVLEYNNKNK